MALVQVPPLMRDLTAGQATVRAPLGGARTVAQVVAALDVAHPGFMERLMPGGQLDAGLRVVIDGQIAPLGLRTRVGEESEIRFVPLLGGG